MLSREAKRREKDNAEETDGHDGGWKKVSRKGKNKAVITFYVSNLQEDITVLMIRNAVKSLGKLVDVYIPGRKDKSGSFFAFVRFEGVTDSTSIVNAMNEIRCGNCILRTNVAKSENSAGNTNRNPNPPIPPLKKPPPPPPTTPTVQLKSVESMTSCNNYCLTEEVVDVNLLEDLHVLIHDDEHIFARTYYAGGLRVILKFINPASAESYLKQKHKWNRWFTYLKHGFINEPNPERLARVNITGILVHLRSDENITAIVSKFRKVLTIDGHNWHTVDLSVGFATILTSSWKVINAEVKGVFNAIVHTIGVIENDNSWEPFMGRPFPDPPPSVVHADNSSDGGDDEERDSDDDDSDVSGVPETWDIPATQDPNWKTEKSVWTELGWTPPAPIIITCPTCTKTKQAKRQSRRKDGRSRK
ncbi:hypothetical protein LXL04_025225 [Taraxacum kok-saghyz]